MVIQAVTAAAAAREDGWASLSQVGSFLLKTNPSFDPRNYGCQKLGELMKLQKYLEMRETVTGEAGNLHLHVRIKKG
jgi:hypothetical protein